MAEDHWSERGDSQYREKCIEAKGELCFFCRSQEIVVHHLDGDRDNGDIDNLLPVCDSCHKRHLHGNGEAYPLWSNKLQEGVKDSEYNVYGLSAVEMHSPTRLMKGAKAHFDRLNLLYRSAYGEEMRSFNDFLQYLIEEGIRQTQRQPDNEVIEELHGSMEVYHNAVEDMRKTPEADIENKTDGKGDEKYGTVPNVEEKKKKSRHTSERR